MNSVGTRESCVIESIGFCFFHQGNPGRNPKTSCQFCRPFLKASVFQALHSISSKELGALTAISPSTGGSSAAA